MNWNRNVDASVIARCILEATRICYAAVAAYDELFFDIEVVAWVYLSENDRMLWLEAGRAVFESKKAYFPTPLKAVQQPEAGGGYAKSFPSTRECLCHTVWQTVFRELERPKEVSMIVERVKQSRH